MTLIEGIGDEVTFVAITVVFVTSLLASIQLFPESLRFLQNLYGYYFSRQELPVTPESQTNSTACDPPNETEAKCDSENKTDCAVGGDSPTDNDHQNTTTEQTQSGEEAVQDDPEVEKSEDQPVNDNSTEQNENVTDTTGFEDEPISRSLITVRLKYLNDTERNVMTEPTETIGNFKRSHFVQELSSQKTVRLIFNGQLLRDNITLQNYGIVNGTVVHVQISQSPAPQVSQGSSSNGDLDISNLLWPLLSVILGIFWVLYVRYPEYFTVPSIIMLITFSVSFLLVYVRSQLLPA